MNSIFIIGTSHHNTLSMVRSFGEEGIKVTLYIYGSQESYISSSRYVDSVFYFSKASEAVDSISKIAEESCEKPIVIACTDEISSLMDMRYKELISKCHFFNAGEAGRITQYMDKQKQLVLAGECGFSTPTSIDAKPQEINLQSINFPCFIKPKASIYGGKKLAICNDQEDLKLALSKYDSKYNVLVQDYINKEYEIVILGLSLGGQTIIPGFIQKHREDKGGTTFSTVRSKFELDKNIISASKLLINKIGYQGLWGIECIKQGDEYFFLELNMRNDATTYSMKVAGVNLPYLYMQMIESHDYKFENSHINSINSIVEFQDFNFVLRKKVGLFKWIRDYRKAKCKYYFSHSDPHPFKQMQLEYIKFLLKRIFKF